MKGFAATLAAGLLALGTTAGANGPAPLTLESALEAASRRPPDRVLADSRSSPYVAMVAPRPVPSPKDAARVEMMARFFEVLLVDLEEAAQSARMSTAFVAWERLHRQKADDTATLKAHHLYATLLSRLNRTRDDQHRVRAALARLLGTPDSLPGEVVEPPDVAELAPVADGGSPDARPADREEGWLERETTRRELEWLLRDETRRVVSRSALAARLVDEARAALDAGGSADLGNASAEAMEAMRDSRGVAFAIALARERLRALAPSARGR